MTTPFRQDPQKEILNLKGKVNALSILLRLGHESFQKNTLHQLALAIINNSCAAAAYDRSALVDMRAAWPGIVAVSGQPEVNRDSEYSNQLVNLLRPFRKIDKPMIVGDEELEKNKAAKGAFEALNYFKSYNAKVLLIPMRPVNTGTDSRDLFIWVVEFFENSNAQAGATLLPLLAQHYSEALWSMLQAKKRTFPEFIAQKKYFSLSRVTLSLLIVFILALAVFPVRQNVAAEFEIMPPHENITYAPFDGIVKEVFFNSGDQVVPDNNILVYDTQELFYNLSSAQKAYDETTAELDMVRQQSFSDIKQRSKVRMLELKKARSLINIEKNRWLLSKSTVKAEVKGILDIGDKKKLEGKAVRAGEKLFEILGSEDLIAQVSLNEQNASVLSDHTALAMYLHSRPETLLEGEICAVSPKPVLTENKTYCYLIKVKLKGNHEQLLCGMRGVARVSGEKVSLGYYLFRNMVLWWRKV